MWRDNVGVYWSNEPIPQLYGMPEHVKKQMPDSQKELIDAIEDFRLKLAPAKDAANDFARQEIMQGVQNDSRKFLDDYWKRRQSTGGLDGWVGRFRVQEGNSTEVLFLFGHAYGWFTHGKVYPFAKDRDCAYMSQGGLCQIAFAKTEMSDTAKATLMKMRDGEWVRIEASLEPGEGVGRLPSVHMDRKGHSEVEGGSIRCKLREIKSIPTP